MEDPPPIANPNAEREVLGSILLDPDLFSSIRGIVGPQDFYVPAHAVTFNAMCAIAQRDEPITIITLEAELKAMERLRSVGDVVFLGELTDNVATTVHAETHALIVANAARCRRLAQITWEATVRLSRGEPIEGTVANLLSRGIAREEKRSHLVPLAHMIDGMLHHWENPEPVIPVQMRQFNTMLADGLRAGDMVGVVGSAGGGKSAFVGQVALDAALSGATVIYASVEMPARELLSRWVALLAFRAASLSGLDWAIEYRDVYYGRAWRGETAYSPEVREAIRNRLMAASIVLDTARDRLFVEQIEPGATVEELGAIVATARERSGREGPVVLVVDPLQRLFASQRGGRRGKAADSVNANETERVGAVAQELKFMADTSNLAVIFTSDTTKAAAMSTMSSAGSMRGSYQLNHLATVVLGIHVATTPEAMRTRMNGTGRDAEPLAPELTEERIAAMLPHGFLERRDTQRLGARVALLECSKHRRGAATPMVLGFVPGATCFVEGAE